MKAPDAVIRDRLYLTSFIRQVAEYIIGSGGKRLRPAMVLNHRWRRRISG